MSGSTVDRAPLAGGGPPLPRAGLVAEITAEARRRAREPGFPAARVERIRTAAARLAAGDIDPADIRHAALLLERQASVDLEVPTASRVPGVHLVKRTLKALMIWYLRFLAAQISALGHAVARMGIVVATRVDQLDERIAELEERVRQLEQGRDGGT